MDISIQTANVDSPEWLELFVKSVRMMTRSVSYEIVVIDQESLDENLVWVKKQKDVRLICLPSNFGHGGAIDLGVNLARAHFVCFLDVDAHIQRTGWETDLMDLYNSDPAIRLIGCIGPEHKPLHPPLFFFERQFIKDNDISFRHIPDITTDTAQGVYWTILKSGFKVYRLEKGKKIYEETRHDEVWLNNLPTFAHFWYGTRFCENRPERTKQELDGYSLDEYLEHKQQFFNEALIKAILNG